MVAGSNPARPTIESLSDEEGFLFLGKWLVLGEILLTVLVLFGSRLRNTYEFGGKVDF